LLLNKTEIDVIKFAIIASSISMSIYQKAKILRYLALHLLRRYCHTGFPMMDFAETWKNDSDHNINNLLFRPRKIRARVFEFADYAQN
jgi:phage pi2 protein 07